MSALLKSFDREYRQLLEDSRRAGIDSAAFRGEFFLGAGQSRPHRRAMAPASKEPQRAWMREDSCKFALRRECESC